MHHLLCPLPAHTCTELQLRPWGWLQLLGGGGALAPPQREIGVGVQGQLHGGCEDTPMGAGGGEGGSGVQIWHHKCANPGLGLMGVADPYPDGKVPAMARLLVGAPQALALPGQGANRTGGLFACPLTSELSDCWRVPIDEGGELCARGGSPALGGLPIPSSGGILVGLTLLSPTVDLQRESKENQWLGVSVKSQGAGGKIVVSARGEC